MRTLDNNVRILRENYAPLAAIPEDQLLGLIRSYELEAGDRISFNAGQEECVFVLSGEVEQSGDGEPTLLGPHNTLTRPVCLAGSDSTFTATQTSVLGRINPARLDFLLSWESLRTDTRTDDSFHEWLGRLRNPLIFSQLPLENAHEVFRRSQPRDVGEGEIIFDMGEEAQKFYFIERGSAELWRPELYDDELRMTKILAVGDYFGEEALVTGGVRNARIRMVEDSRLLVLDKEDFDELINAPMIDRVSPGVANAMLMEGANLLDVRYEEEYEMEYIPGCTLIPLLELRERVSELGSGTDYVVYCHSGKRSDVAAMILRQHRLNAVSLVGGIRDWPYEVEYPD
ncbi:MAG: cyclic nucleotide-binding domain-containing protein [Xanthomonadales bacterium]|nr:cyclic nucleotide-binding domain-containing protein [Gammaproteobacteria bacterium]NNK03102.1 cyclic nucleotide-binding domain-containing protein [Xanthomonadales bacterium]